MSAPKAARNKHLNRNVPTNANYNAPRIDVTKEEFDRISEAMKKEEFRKLFLEYCEEIQDPENCKRYEADIIQLEAERGVDVKFINPEPGFVIKTSVNGQSKCFVNVAKSDKVDKPSNEMHTDPNTGRRGLNWALPLAQTAPRDDIDANGKRCRVYDVVFHPDTLRMGERNQLFRKCLIDTALDAVERTYEVKLDRTNLKFPKLNFKGIARPTVIRTLSKEAPPEDDEPNPLEDIYPAKPAADAAVPKKMPIKTEISKEPEFTKPNYTIKHSRNIDYAECTYEIDAKIGATLPRHLVVEIELPLLKSTAECQLDVTPRTVYLLSERAGAKYRLNVDLPYEVNDKEGVARFDKDTRRLELTLPVKPATVEQQRNMYNSLIHLHREDSGVESDVRDEVTSNPRSSPVEELHSGDSMHDESDDVTYATLASPITTSTEKQSSNSNFLNPTISYKFPQKFDCNMLDNMMSVVLHVYNVQQESICLLQQERSVYLRFASLGGGYFPTHYAFYLELPENSGLKLESAAAEAWENNLVLNLSLMALDENSAKVNCKSYLAGINSQELKEYAVQSKFQLPAKSRRDNKSPCYVDVNIEHSASGDKKSVAVAIRPRAHTPPRSYKEDKKQERANKSRRSYSESACDDFNKACRQQDDDNEEQLQQNLENMSIAEQTLDIERTQAYPIPSTKTNNNNNNTDNINNNMPQRKQRSYSECRSNSIASNSTLPPSFKGILKRRSRYDMVTSISDSYSSIDESSCGCSADTGMSGCYSLPKSFNNCIPEEDTAETTMSESCKKTVRFNDIIKKQVFRMDSSILGQRKKNQKCRDRKQRALQRRVSEGDSADYEDNNSLPQNSNKINNKMQYLKQNQCNNNNSKCKHNEKNKNKQARARLESESSSDVENNKNSMMFEMDM